MKSMRKMTVKPRHWLELYCKRKGIGILEAIEELSKRSGKSWRQVYRVFAQNHRLDSWKKAKMYSQLTNGELPPEAFLEGETGGGRSDE